MYLSFCQVLPISTTEPAGFCRWKDVQIKDPKDASICAVVDGKLDNQTTSTFGTYQPQLVEFRPLQIGMWYIAIEAHAVHLNTP